MHNVKALLKETLLCNAQLAAFIVQQSGNETLVANETMKRIWRILLDPEETQLAEKNFRSYRHYTRTTEFLMNYNGHLWNWKPSLKDEVTDFTSSLIKAIPNPDSARESLIWVRWYNYKRLAALDEKKEESALVVLSARLARLLGIHCRMIGAYLKVIDNDQDFLREFIRTWTEYFLSVMELEELFEALTQRVQEAYAKLFPKLLKRPKYNVWRLFVKIFIEEVFKPLSQRIYKAYAQSFRTGLVNKLLKSEIAPSAKAFIEDWSA